MSLNIEKNVVREIIENKIEVWDKTTGLWGVSFSDFHLASLEELVPLKKVYFSLLSHNENLFHTLARLQYTA